jgi:hypothetical protein
MPALEWRAQNACVEPPRLRLPATGFMNSDAKGTEREGWMKIRILARTKKRSSQASWKHAAWELLSPDLRCFWKHHVEI